MGIKMDARKMTYAFFALACWVARNHFQKQCCPLGFLSRLVDAARMSSGINRMEAEKRGRGRIMESYDK